MVVDALPDAFDLRFSTGLPGLVPDADGPGYAEEPAGQSGGDSQAASNTQAVFAEEAEEGGRAVLAHQTRNHCNNSIIYWDLFIGIWVVEERVFMGLD